ncbi:hypothetical protein ACHAXT_010766 [Thalassiosira profunda]
MPLKKKERGKARRAKAGSAPKGGGQPHAPANDIRQLQITHQQEQLQTREILERLSRLKRNPSDTDDEGGCRHGCGPPPSTDPGALESVETLIGNLFEEARLHHAYILHKTTGGILGREVPSEGDLLPSGCCAFGDIKWTTAFLASVGADCLLGKMGNNDLAFVAAMSILKIESESTLEPISIDTMRNLLENTEREANKFLSKRIPCQCLDERYKQLKETAPRTGICSNCRETKRCKDLMLCTRCRLTQYCSRECQTADWSRHKKEECDEMSCYDKRLAPKNQRE